jgi:hypothetical protein
MTAHHKSVPGFRLSAIGYRLSAIGDQLSAIGHRRWSIGCLSLGIRFSGLSEELLK